MQTTLTLKITQELRDRIAERAEQLGMNTSNFVRSTMVRRLETDEARK